MTGISLPSKRHGATAVDLAAVRLCRGGGRALALKPHQSFERTRLHWNDSGAPATWSPSSTVTLVQVPFAISRSNCRTGQRNGTIGCVVYEASQPLAMSRGVL